MPTPAATHTGSRHGIWRWAVALVATVMLVVSGSGLVVFAQSGAGESRGPQFVPADAAIYLEGRLDMPAGQDEALAQMLTAFPGFADTSSFDMKLEELLSGLGSEMGLEVPMDEVFGDVLTGEIGLAIVDFDEAVMSGTDPLVLVGMAIADPDMAQAMLDDLTAEAAADGSASEEMYADTAIISDATTAAAVHADWLLLSNDVEQVKASIDVLDGSAESLADQAAFAEAFARVPVAHLAAAYVDLASFGGLLDMAGMMASGQAGVELPMGDLGAMLPSNMVAYLAAEPDRINLEAVVTPGEQTAPLPVGESDLATVFPSDTQVYLEAREVGSSVESALGQIAELLEEQEGLLPGDGAGGEADGMSDIEMLFGEDSPIASILGAPLPQVLDFVDDLGVGLGLDSDGMWLGIAGEVNDEDVATERVSNVVSLLRLFGGDPAESGISVETEMVGDVEVTRIVLPLDTMTAEAGVPIELGDALSVAVADGKLLLGLGDFVQTALLGDAGDSLAASAGYLDALGEDAVNAGFMYMNASEMVTELDPLFASMVEDWEDIQPYASAADSIVAVMTGEDDGAVRMRLTKVVDS